MSTTTIREWLTCGPSLIRAYVTALVAAGAVLWAVILVHSTPAQTELEAPVPRWLVLALLAYATEAWVVHVHYRRQAHTLSLNELVLVLGLFYASPLVLLLAQLVGPTLALAVVRRQRSVKLVFNIAQLMLTTGIAVAIFGLTVGFMPEPSYGTWLAAMVACSVSCVTGVALVAVAIGIAEREWSLAEIARTAAFSMAGTLAAGSLALAAVELISSRPAAVALLVLPVGLCGLALRSYMNQRQESERVEFLYESMRKTQEAADLGLAARELLHSARHLLRADYAEILLVASDGKAANRSTSSDDGDVLMRHAPLTEIELATVSHMFRSSRGVLLPRHRSPHAFDPFLEERGVEDAIIASLRGEDRLLGLILVGERASDVATFEDDDVALLETFAGHTSVVLENNRLEQSLAQVTELKEQLHHQVLHDHLTGLPNRAQFAEAVRRSLDYEAGETSSTAVLFLDLDGFKAVNDSLGHAAGDELLVQVADRLRATVRPGDMPSRLGGDEFAVVLDHVNEAGVRRAIDRILEALERPYQVAGREILSHASIGVALARSGTDAEELIRNADIAMYTAKADELRRYAFYEPAFHTRLRRRRELALELERAAARGELEVHFQPVIALADGSVHAFEALARWRHPERGLLPAGEFIPVAEENGLIVDIGKSVITSACAQASEWTDAAPRKADIGLWLNLSPAEFSNNRLVEDLAVAIASARLDPRQITVEVTESSVVRDQRQSTETLERLRMLGVAVSIDDFGTGYSSLSRLGSLPIDMLKIPKPFVDRLAGPNPDETIVDAVLRLAASLGLTAVAEGVESEDQLVRLKALGCGLAQGHFLGRPADRDETLRRLRGTSPAESVAFS